MAKNNIITVRFLDDLAGELDCRHESRAEAVRRSLERYYDLLERTRKTLRSEVGGLPPFTQGELGALVDANNGTHFEPWSISLVAANVEDSIPDGIGEKWHINVSELVDKLNAMDDVECHALVDAIERWWLDEDRKDPGTLLD